MIENAPGFEIGALTCESGSPFNHLPLQLSFFLSFVPFMSFLFRLLETVSQPELGSPGQARM